MDLMADLLTWYPYGMLVFILHILCVHSELFRVKGVWFALVVATAVYPVVYVVAFFRMMRRMNPAVQ